MLIEWTLLNDIRNHNGDFKCKAILKLRQKQFNILSSEYSKFLIYNKPSFATKNSAEVCMDIAFAKKILRSSYFNGHHFTKTNSCNS